MTGLLGKKIGMTRVFDEQGRHLPVTVIECGPCVVLQRKRKNKEGYNAVQLGFGDTRESRLKKPVLAAFKKFNISPKQHRCEFRLGADDEYKEGDVINVSLFEGVSHVDVVGVTKGKGFQGVVRRYGMSGGPMTHGGHAKRKTGAIGCGTIPGRVYKGRHMPGHMGHVRVTQQNLKVVQILGQDNVILVGGSIPGHAGTIVMVKKALKKGETT